ncbi:MAG: hypothetical protein ACOC5T_05685 [Elusimicrobiota bacterium]
MQLKENNIRKAQDELDDLKERKKEEQDSLDELKEGKENIIQEGERLVDKAKLECQEKVERRNQLEAEIEKKKMRVMELNIYIQELQREARMKELDSVYFNLDDKDLGWLEDQKGILEEEIRKRKKIDSIKNNKERNLPKNRMTLTPVMKEDDENSTVEG